ncbi:MAG: hypothetical protein JXM75_10800 [Chromatiaceae bacterium]|nr:hypothetical protein [Chromatiaceae bacterium]
MSIRVTATAIAIPLMLGLAGCGQKVSYTANIKPLLDEHCVECHLPGGMGTEASGFQVDSYANLMKGTKFGPVIVPGDPLSSSLYRLIAGEVDASIRMPHDQDPLADEQIAMIERWIVLGAPE